MSVASAFRRLIRHKDEVLAISTRLSSVTILDVSAYSDQNAHVLSASRPGCRSALGIVVGVDDLAIVALRLVFGRWHLLLEDFLQ